MIKFLRKLFISNYKIKILSLILASMLWLFVASNQSLLGKFPNQIKIKPANASDDYQPFFDQDTVQLSIMAEPGVWRSLTADSFAASVDLAGLHEGTYELDVRVVSNIPDVQITKVEPAKVFVTIEKIVTKSVTLTTKVEGDPADGMVLGEITLDPESVEVRGPGSYVEAISEASALIKLNGESESFERVVSVTALTENSSEASEISFTPSTVNAKVTIVKGGNNRTVGVRVKTKGNPKDNFYISKIVVNPVAVDIVGQRSILANINYLETEEIDISAISEPLVRDAILILPTGVSLQKGVSPRVRVEINFAVSGGSKTISPTLSPLGLSEGLRLISYSPGEITVVLGGPQSLLEALTASDVKLEVNLAGYGPGAYNLDLDIGMLRLPAGVVATSITPTSLSIVLGN